MTNDTIEFEAYVGDEWKTIRIPRQEPNIYKSEFNITFTERGFDYSSKDKRDVIPFACVNYKTENANDFVLHRDEDVGFGIALDSYILTDFCIDGKSADKLAVRELFRQSEWARIPYSQWYDKRVCLLEDDYIMAVKEWLKKSKPAQAWIKFGEYSNRNVAIVDIYGKLDVKCANTLDDKGFRKANLEDAVEDQYLAETLAQGFEPIETYEITHACNRYIDVAIYD